MLAMPTPTGWGDRPRPSKAKGYWRLDRGELAFERLSVRLLPENRPPKKSDDDPIIGSESELRRRLTPRETGAEKAPPAQRMASFAEISDTHPDYYRPGESDSIRDELIEQLRALSFRLVACIISTVFLGLMELLPTVGVALPDMFLPEKAPVVYLSLNLLLGAFCVFLCRSVFIGGFYSLKKLKPDGEGVLLIASAAVLLQILAELVFCLITRSPVHRVCTAPLLLALCINDIGLLCMTRRTARNFSFVALRSQRLAARVLPETLSFDEAYLSGEERRGHIVYSVKTKYLSNYLDYGYEEDFCEQMSARLTPYVVFVALAAGIIGGIGGFSAAGLWSGIYCFCICMVAGAPAARLLCLNLPLNRCAKWLLKRGVMLNGWAGVDEFGLSDTLAVSAQDLFPQGTVKALTVKPFGNEPVESAILAAASVVIPAGGPLAQVFSELIGSHHELLLKVEGLGYERDMGVSAWVDDRPVLVGNRKLLEMHGCASPSNDYEEHIGKGRGKEIVYVAVSGVPRAALCVQYSPDYETVDAVRALVASGVSLVVYTCDANITAKLVSEMYAIPLRFISILNTRSGSEYDKLTRDLKPDAPALLASDKGLAALCDGVCAAKQLRGLLIFSSIIQMVCFGLCLTLVAVLCCIAPETGISPAQLMLLQLICPVAALVGLLRRVI